jgi:hypothetical protein
MVCQMRKLADKESVETRSRPGQVATQDRHMSYTKDAANDVARGYRTCWPLGAVNLSEDLNHRA